MMTPQESSTQLYILNSPVLSSFGDWRFEPLPVARAREVARDGFVSAVGHPASATFLGSQLGVEVPVNRVAIEMRPGDQAIVLRLKGRLPEGTVLTDAQMQEFPFELGLLTRLPEASG